MKFLGRRRRAREERRVAVMDGLQALKREFSHPSDQRYINDMLLYVEIGPDRYRLDESWVARTRRHLLASRAREPEAVSPTRETGS